ncbi:MAG: L-aspartate oxidase, partial [Phycisphaerae bacterium]|nr:L-aspartate oxidase [Phycisphaerae bacterium]
MDIPYLQRRYLVSFASRRLPHIFTDVLVIGSGAAGVRAAIEAARHGEVILMTKHAQTESNTWHAQGGMAVPTDAARDLDAHVADTLAAGGELCDEAVARDCLAAAPRHLQELREWGVTFDTDDGELQLGREGGHHKPRIVHADGDSTGRAIMLGLLDRARQTPNLKIFDECFALDLLTDPPEAGSDARCVGALTDHPRFGMQIIRARTVILASGGAGVLWRETSNPPVATADGIAMAFRTGVALTDLEMMQFHPTTLYVAGASRSLISEAVRGEGAKLVDRNGHRFMPDYHEMAELAPRDIVSRAILDVAARSGSSRVYLDVRDLGAEFFAGRFPGIDRACREFDIDPGEDLIPVFPAAHYMIGGLRADMEGRTSLSGLFACGEAACTGLHGANRLASNSITEALVFGARCGDRAGREAADDDGKFTARDVDWTVQRSDRTELDLADIRNSLRSIMWRNVGILRSGPRLAETLEIIQFWGRYVLDKEFFS